MNTIRQNITAPCCFSKCKIDLVWAGGPGGNPSHVIVVALPCFSSLNLSSLQFTKIIFLCWRQASAIKIASKIPVVIPSLDDPFNSAPLSRSCLTLPFPFFYSPSLYLQRWCMRWSLATWQPLSRGCTPAGPSTTPEPKTSRTSFVSIICRRASSSECWSIFRQPGRSITVSILMRYDKRSHLNSSKPLSSFFS